MCLYVISTRSFAASAVIAMLALSACGEKKESYHGGSRDAGTAESQTLATGKESSTESVKRGSVDTTSTKRASDGGLPSPGGPETFNGQNNAAPPVTLRPQSVASPELLMPPKLPNFTTSAPDNLVLFLTTKLTDRTQDADTKVRDFKAALSVLSAKADRDPKSGIVSINLRLEENSKPKVYVLSGLVRAKSVNDLVVKSAGKALAAPVSGQMSAQVSAQIQCLDENGECENTLLTLKTGGGLVFIVFRDAIANLYFDLPGTHSENPEYLNMRQFVINSTKKTDSPTQADLMKLKTFEVIHGRAGFEAQIKTYDSEWIAFAGPLIGPTKGTPLNEPLHFVSKPNEFDTSEVKDGLAKTIENAHLIANNGEGAVEISLTMRKRSGFPQDVFKVRFTRDLNPVMALTDLNVN